MFVHQCRLEPMEHPKLCAWTHGPHRAQSLVQDSTQVHYKAVLHNYFQYIMVYKVFFLYWLEMQAVGGWEEQQIF